MNLNPETKTFTKMGFRILRPLFPLGDVYLSAGAAALALDPAEIDRLLNRHHCGDWGDLDSEDKRANDHDLKDGERLLSRYDIEVERIKLSQSSSASFYGFASPAAKTAPMRVAHESRSARFALRDFPPKRRPSPSRRGMT